MPPPDEALAPEGPERGSSRADTAPERYASKDHRDALDVEGIVPSMSRRRTVRDALGEYIAIFYNPIRRQSTIGGVSPAMFVELARSAHPEAA